MPEPAELTALLAAEPPVLAAWQALTPAQRQEYQRWVAGAGDAAARGRRLDRLAHRLRGAG